MKKLMFLLLGSLLFGQECYESKKNDDFMILDGVDLLYKSGDSSEIIFEKVQYNRNGKYIFTTKMDLSFKLKGENINVLGSGMIRKNILEKIPCTDEKIKIFENLKKM